MGTIDGSLVGVIEFTRPVQLYHKGDQGFHWFNKDVKNYLDILMETHNFTVYHLGNGNIGECSSKKEQKWIPTNKWQELPVIRRHIKQGELIDVPISYSQLDDLEIFKRAAVVQDRKLKKEKPSGVTGPKQKLFTTAFYKNTRTGHTALTPAERQKKYPTQFGSPCEFKTQAFTKPFKFYTKYVEGLKEAYGFKVGQKVAINANYQGRRFNRGDIATIAQVDGDNITLNDLKSGQELAHRTADVSRKYLTLQASVKISHHTRVIRTVPECDILNNESVELKRFRTLELLRKQVLKSAPEIKQLKGQVEEIHPVIQRLLENTSSLTTQVLKAKVRK